MTAPETTEETVDSVFEIRNMTRFETKWAEIAKRAERTGVSIGYEILARRVDRVRNCDCVACDGRDPLHGTHPETVWTIKVWGETPMFAGYTLVAVVDDLNEAMRQVRGVPGHEATLPDSLWTTDSHCDHCGHNRQRNTVIVLSDENGELVQIGTSCVKDFLGGHSPADVAWMATWLPEFSEGLADNDNGGWGSSEMTYDPKAFLTLAVASIDTKGWVSRGMVKAAAERDY